jgi:RNA polymerase sigma-70 factor, ECF subfamily
LERMSIRVEITRPGEMADRPDVASVHDEQADFVWLSLLRLGVHDADVEDLLQEVFVVVHKRLHSFDGSSRITTWLFGICLRVVAAHRRRAHRRHEESVAQVPERVAHEAGSPEQAVAAREEEARLRAILDLMDLEKRAIFVMFEIEELSCEAIADMLSVPVGTVYSRLHAARKDFERAIVRLGAIEASQLASRRRGHP